MKIGMVTACYKPVINGVTRMVSLYKDTLGADGHEVTVFTLGDPDPAGEDDNVVRSPAVPLGDSGYYFTFGYSRDAQSRLRQMEIIHCHHLFMSVDMAHRYGNCPIVYTNHTRYDLYTEEYTPLPRPAADAFMRQIWPEFTDYCDVVIAPSDGVRRVMTSFGVRQRIDVIPNGIALDPFWEPAQPQSKATLGIPAEAILLVYTGRVASEKNLLTLITQFALARDILPELHLLIVGEEPLWEKVRQRAAELGVAAALHMPGAVPYAQVSNMLAAADLFVTASVTEVHPLSVIEAMAAGLPVAAVSSPGIVDSVEHGHTGYLAHKAEGLAAAIVAVVADRARCVRMGVAAREASRRYDIRATTAQTIALYEELRQTRPDLRRNRGHGHGRWLQTGARTRLEQLARLLSPGRE
jgi:glycosyltransferase involved in cell wall biosynthesis